MRRCSTTPGVSAPRARSRRCPKRRFRSSISRRARAGRSGFPLAAWDAAPRRAAAWRGRARACPDIGLLAAGPGRSVAEAVRGRGAMWRAFWVPMTTAVLNAPPERASAALLRAALTRTFLRGAAACRPVLAPRGLGAALVDPAVAPAAGARRGDPVPRAAERDRRRWRARARPRLRGERGGGAGRGRQPHPRRAAGRARASDAGCRDARARSRDPQRAFPGDAGAGRTGAAPARPDRVERAMGVPP